MQPPKSSATPSRRTNTNGQPDAVVPYGQRRVNQGDSGATTQPSPHTSQQATSSRSPPSTYFARPSQMQIALQGSQPSHMQLAPLESQRQYLTPPAPPIRPLRPIRHFLAPPPAVVVHIYPSQPSPFYSPHRSIQPTPSHHTTSRPVPTLPNTSSLAVNRHPLPSIREPDGRSKIEPTLIASRPQTGRTHIIRPGEPHHFGISTSPSGAILCTLCRCTNPAVHSDAYTMLNSPRGLDTNGVPIDWQTAKTRMLDYHGKDQITHAEEVAAIPFVFDKETAAKALANERELVEGVKGGRGVEVNVRGNEMRWH